MTLKDFIEVTKFRMVPMVWITAAFGYILAQTRGFDALLMWTLFFMTPVSLGSAPLNNYFDRDRDILMTRTQNRVLPAERVPAKSILIMGILFVLFGVLGLGWSSNLKTAGIMLLASFLYVAVYTPLKRVTWWNTFVGAFPGALPPLAGWLAATNEFGWGGIVLFGILFTWQFPHFFAIAVMHRDDYARGGFKMLPVLDPTNDRTAKQIMFYTVALLILSLMPGYLNMAGAFYLSGAVFLGMLMLILAFPMGHSENKVAAKRLFRMSLIYLPALLLCLVIDLGILL